MALEFCDSFDHYATADLLKKWTTAAGNSKEAISAGNGRNSTASLRFTYASAQVGVTRTLTAKATRVVGLAWKVSNLSITRHLIGFLDGSTLHCDLRLNTNGTLTVTRNGTALGTSALALAADAWYYIEFKATISDASGVAVVRVNGVTWLDLSGVDTRNGGNATSNVLRLGLWSAFVGSATDDLDDLYVCNSDGATNNDFLGDCRVAAVLPSGAGNSTQWTPSAGANYACVADAAPDNDTTFVSSATAGHKDTYALGDIVTTAGTIFGVQTNLLARKDDAGARTLRSVVRSAGNESVGATVGLSDSYVYQSDVFETQPDGAAWTVAAVNAAEAGPELVS